MSPNKNEWAAIKNFHLCGATCMALFLCLWIQLCNLQKRNEKKIILIKLGMFYIATGRDEVLLYDKLNLKCTCFTDNVCKVGVPVTAIDKYIEKLDKTGYGHIIFNYYKDKM